MISRAVFALRSYGVQLLVVRSDVVMVSVVGVSVSRGAGHGIVCVRVFVRTPEVQGAGTRVPFPEVHRAAPRKGLHSRRGTANQ